MANLLDLLPTDKRIIVGEIRIMGVDRDYRSKRVGRKLMTYALEDLKKRGSRVVRLMTRVDNDPLANCIRHLGLRRSGRTVPILSMRRPSREPFPEELVR